jgi:hypothetical protein
VIVATEALLLVHERPEVISVSEVVVPVQIIIVPAIAAGSGLMVTVAVR